jgi:hypothetical protein
MSLHRVAYPTSSYSSRGGAAVRLLVVHTAEGARTIESLGSFFANPANQVSSHAGADDKVNTIGVYVRKADKAWTAADYNPVACQIELCGFAAWDSAEWHNHPNMLENCASWIREEAASFGIPIVKLSPAAAQGAGRGVCQHRDLGSGGGGHSDCGDGFPIDEVIARAGGQLTPPPPQEVDDMKSVGVTFEMNPGQDQQVFAVVEGGHLAHWYWTAARGWIRESLGTGWDEDSEVTYYRRQGGQPQVWALRKSSGEPCQVYWNGHQWVTQPLP